MSLIHGAFVRGVVVGALASLAPFSTVVHAARQVGAGELVRQATPSSMAPAAATAPSASARTALMPRGSIVPVWQTSSPAPDRQAGPSVADRQRLPALHWLTQINAARASAGLRPVVEDAEWSAASVLHSRYMVKNNDVGHDEETNNPWYTPEGRAAGLNGNAYANNLHDQTDPPGIEAWLTTPFHLMNVLDPRLVRTGFGWYRETPKGPGGEVDPDAYEIGATLDVARGLDAEREPPSYPVVFPGNGQRMPYSRYFGGEHPDPLASCPDRAFQGAPLMVQLESTPEVTSVTLMKDGLQLDRCVFDETSYEHDDADIQALGREVLAGRHAVVIMPREPLTAGVYRVTLVSGGGAAILGVAERPAGAGAPGAWCRLAGRCPGGTRRAGRRLLATTGRRYRRGPSG